MWGALVFFQQQQQYTVNILTVLSTAFGSVTFPAVILLFIVESKAAFNLKLYSSVLLNVMGTFVACNNHFQFTVAQVTQPMTVNWLAVNICSVQPTILPYVSNQNCGNNWLCKK